MQQVAREWLGRPLDEAGKTARRLGGLLAELRAVERGLAEEPAFRFEPGGVGGQAGGGQAGGSQAGGKQAGGGQVVGGQVVGGQPAGGQAVGPQAVRGQSDRSRADQADSRAPHSGASPLDLPTAELLHLIRTRQLSAVKVTEAALDRMAEREGEVNAFVTRLPERALAQAAAIDAAIQRGEPVGALAGLPVALKDLIDLEGVPTTACSTMRATAIAETDAEVTTRLLKAGAVIIGKTATHEWAYGTTCDSRLHGSTHNPVALEHSPGGSSGGSAAAVAAGVVPGALGTDTAGSLRIPAACCGVVGFKPTFGRISRAGILPLSHSLDHGGPIGRSVADVALLYAIISDEGGQSAEGWGQVSRPASGPPTWVPGSSALGSLAAVATGASAREATTLAGLRIGLPDSWLTGPIDLDVAASFEASLDRLRQRGAEIVPVALPSLELGHFISRILTLAEGAAVHAANLDRMGEYPPDVRARLELGQFILARDYLLAQQLRTRYCRETAAAMAGVDLVLTPTQPIPAPRLDQRLWTYADGAQEAAAEALTRFVAPANVTGQPALSLPCGRTPEGLPVGLQLLGHPDRDPALLGAATLIEAALKG